MHVSLARGGTNQRALAATGVFLTTALSALDLGSQTRPPDQPRTRRRVIEAVDSASLDHGVLADPLAVSFRFPPEHPPSASELRAFRQFALKQRPPPFGLSSPHWPSAKE